MILKYAKTGDIDDSNCVNKETSKIDLFTVNVRHFDKPGVLSHVF